MITQSEIINLMILYFLGVGYFALIAYMRVNDYRARFVNLPKVGETLPGGVSGVFLECSK